MIDIRKSGACYNKDGTVSSSSLPDAYKKTMTYKIIARHNTKGETSKNNLVRLKADAVTSHDITYVGIIQTAKAIGLEKFPIPYVLTNCHNSLCAVGGTINEDDHAFGLSAAKKYGGIFVPPHFAVIHTYMRECFAGPGKFIIGSDSHTRYGALGTLAIGEGGPEIVKQLIGQTYDIQYPEVVGIRLIGSPIPGVGPQDVALAIIQATFQSGILKNKVLEFFGPGVGNIPIEFRNGIDVMTTETTCLSSIWETDEETHKYLNNHNRPSEYIKLSPEDGAYYDAYITIDLSTIRPMIALPFHPSNVFTIDELVDEPFKILKTCEEAGRELLGLSTYKLTDKINADGKILINQAVIAGCAGGTFDNIVTASRILKNSTIQSNIPLSVYCGSQPIYLDLLKKGILSDLIESGAIIKTSFCGPCFGACDVPQNNGLSIRHTTRNFPSREGSKPGDGQIASVCLMDSRSIAWSVSVGGYIASACYSNYDSYIPTFHFDDTTYKRKVYNGYISESNLSTNKKFNKKILATEEVELVYGPNIADWPIQPKLPDNLIMKIPSVINDDITTTDELIPSGETSSYRSNPLRLAEFTLSKKAPHYVANAKAIKNDELIRQTSGNLPNEYESAVKKVGALSGSVLIGSALVVKKPGDGSAREQAASCQRVLGGVANISIEYATKRYRSNLINWGMLPFIHDGKFEFNINDIIIIKDLSSTLSEMKTPAYVVRGESLFKINLYLDDMTATEKAIIKAGCLINFNKTTHGGSI
ncbi:MAG: hydratase [Christensenellaceae bacterium]|jgi:aconitate hydratase|nr:hydratase [Christensenellaceae bacterium]